MNCCYGGSNDDVRLVQGGGDDGHSWKTTEQLRVSSNDAPSKLPPRLDGISQKGRAATRTKVNTTEDGYISEALQTLSLNERDEAYHEIHGVAQVIEEEPSFVAESFKKLRTELAQAMLRPHLDLFNCAAFVHAENHDRDYVHSKRHYKMFLRIERFDAKRAAARMISFFELKERAFGRENVCHDITQGFLTDHDLELFRRGAFQILPYRDRAGRTISIVFPFHLQLGDNSLETLIRLYMYVGWKMAQDEETQRRGVTMIVAATGGDHDISEIDISLVPVSRPALLSLPIRAAVVHNCFSDARFKTFMRLSFTILPRHLRARLKLHFGTWQECAYDLISYGIPEHVLPMTLNDEIKTKHHVAWIAMLKIQEEWIAKGKLQEFWDDDAENETMRHSARTVVVIPASFDVLLGRGKPFSLHPGNAELRRMVDEAVPDYVACGMCKSEKTQVSHGLLTRFQEELGGRFLQQDRESGIWLVADDHTVCLKISHMFRAFRARRSKDELRRQRDKEVETEGSPVRAAPTTKRPRL